MNQHERMVSGLPYIPGRDGLGELHRACLERLYHYNSLPPGRWDEQPRLLAALLGCCGEGTVIHPPFHCDYGFNISVGEHFFANFNLVILDVAPVEIGDNVLFAPNVSIYTAGHPLHPDSRNSGYEYGRQVRIGHNVWLGGNVVVNPGVSIGDNAVVGSGSVVTRDIPADSLAAGNPCRVIRQIGEADREFYFRNLRFDVADYRTPWWERSHRDAAGE